MFRLKKKGGIRFDRTNPTTTYTTITNANSPRNLSVSSHANVSWHGRTQIRPEEVCCQQERRLAACYKEERPPALKQDSKQTSMASAGSILPPTARNFPILVVTTETSGSRDQMWYRFCFYLMFVLELTSFISLVILWLLANIHFIFKIFNSFFCFRLSCSV